MNASFALEILLRASLWGAVALGAAWIVCSMGRHHLGAEVRAWIWRLALAKMILGLVPLSPLALSLLPPVEKAPKPPKVTFAAPERKTPPSPKFSAPVETLQIAPATSNAPISVAPPQPLQRELPAAKLEAPPTSPPFRPNWPLIALSLWAFGALIQAIQLTRGYGVARGLRRAASPLENELAASITAQCCARLSVRRAPQLAISVDGPLLLGTIRPLILLPEPTWHLWNEAELRLILAHEVAHHKRADLRWNFLLSAAQILFYFHPLLWIARREWRACSEQACDELTLRGSRESAALYGALLLRLATQSAANCPAMVGVSEFALLKGRLMELKLSTARRNWPRSVIALSIMAGAASLLPWQLTARAQNEAPQLDGPMLKGILRDTRGRVVADADVFALGWRHQKPFLHTDGNGYYQLSGPSLDIPDTDLLYVRGKTAGFARFDLVSVKGKFGFSALKWLPTSVPKISFVDEANRPVKDWEMRVWSIGKPSHLRPLPPFLRPTFSARTNARGEISFPALPQGMTAQLESGDTDWVDTYYGLPNRRGVRFAPLIASDLVALQGAETRRTIQLLKPATLSGAVKADGAAPNVPIQASLLEARQDASNHNQRRHQLSASMLTDAKGRYQMKGLRPGRYSLYIFPGDNLQPRYTGQFREFVLHSGPNTANLQFTTGARIQGRVVSAKTGRPVAGQTLGLVAPEFSPQYVISRADGSFDFHISAGKQHFWIAANRTNSPPPGYDLPAQNKFDFRLQEGQTKTFLIQLPVTSVKKIITGHVIGPNGAAVAGATVYLRFPFRKSNRANPKATTDAKGNFLLRDAEPVSANISKREFDFAQVFVDAQTRGMSFLEMDSVGAVPMKIHLLPLASARLKFVGEENRPVVDLGVRLWKVGASASSWWSLPAAFKQKFAGRTDARGEVTFPPLPQGRIAQFMLADEKEVPGKFMLGDHRGTRFAPLSTEDFVTLNAGEVRKTIHLRSVANLSGVVKVGDSGVPVGNVQVVARRINAAEARGDISNRDMLMASTRSNARGVYRLDGLRPGNYYLWLYPEKRLTRDWASVGFQKPLVSGQNRVDFPLSQGARIIGHVVSAATGNAVKGQTLGLDGPETNSQYEISRADGSFFFRTAPGKQHFWVHGNGQNSPPPGYLLPTKKEFDFSLKDGQTKTFVIQLPGTSATKPITGRVLGPDGAPVAGAQVEVSGLSSYSFKRFDFQTRSDGNGRFTIPAAKAAKPMRLFAASGALQTARGTVALAGDDVTLKLEAGAGVDFTGYVIDFDSKKPLGGAKVALLQLRGNTWFPIQTISSQSDGKFEFSNQRPSESYRVDARLPGYVSHLSGYTLSNATPVANRQVSLTLRRASSFVAGRVVRADGRPAVGLRVSASGANTSALTNATGHFSLSQTFPGRIEVRISPANIAFELGWEEWWQTVTAGRRDLVIQLDKAHHDIMKMGSGSALTNQMVPKIGQIAPEIRAARWFNSAPLALSSLHGQVVLLDFSFTPLNFGQGAPSDIEEVERAFRGRGLRVIGVQNDVSYDKRTDSDAKIRAQRRAAGTAFPVAVDASSPTPVPARGAKYLIGVTTRAYGLKPRVVIDRAGRVAYAGDSLGDAVSVAAGLLAAKF